jgi:probable dihydroxyacetone kinase regulator
METKQIITDSMFRLLKTRTLDKISIQVLLDDCHVSRATFYKYFKDKYDLMNWCYQSYVDSLLLQFEQGNWKLLLEKIFVFFYTNRDYFEKASKVEGNNSFWNFLYDYSYAFYQGVYLSHSTSDTLTPKERIALEYNCYGSVAIVKKWIENGLVESPHDMAEWTYELISDMFRQYL